MTWSSSKLSSNYYQYLVPFLLKAQSTMRWSLPLMLPSNTWKAQAEVIKHGCIITAVLWLCYAARHKPLLLSAQDAKCDSSWDQSDLCQRWFRIGCGVCAYWWQIRRSISVNDNLKYPASGVMLEKMEECGRGTASGQECPMPTLWSCTCRGHLVPILLLDRGIYGCMFRTFHQFT